MVIADIKSQFKDSSKAKSDFRTVGEKEDDVVEQISEHKLKVLQKVTGIELILASEVKKKNMPP